MASLILDHTQDLSGVETHRLTSLYATPEFVKTASHEQLYGPAEGGLPNHVFADPAHRLYPCHTKAATWVSCLFFMDKYAALAPTQARLIGQNIEKQAAFFGIQPELNQLKKAMAADDGDALSRLSDAMFALVWEGENGAKERHWSLRNDGEVKMAADWFHKYRDEFSYPDRHVMARKILDRADTLELDTGHTEMLQKTAGMGYCAAETAVAAIEKRAGLVARTDAAAAAQLRALADAARACPVETRDQGRRVKLAALLDQFDRVEHLTGLYDEGGLERPEEILFQITEKVARDFLGQHIQLTSGTVYEKAALEQLPVETVREWMGNELVDEVTSGGMFIDTEKLAAIVATLPRDGAEMFDRMAQAVGMPVFARDKAAAATGLSLDEMADLATAYQTQIHLGPPVEV